MKDFYDHGDFRELLRSLYEDCKLKDKKFSYRYFASKAGFGSASFLKRVIDGESRLSLESIAKLAKGFKMSADQAHFFKHLVLLNQSTTAKEKQLHAGEILRSKGYRKIHPLSEAQYNLYTKWYFIPVRELVGLAHFKEDYEWMADQIVPAITPEQVRRSVEELLKIGLLKRDGAGKLVQDTPYFATKDEVVSGAIAHWHKEMMRLAGESIDRTEREARDISSATVRIARKDVPKAKEIIQKFRKDLLELIASNEPDSVYQLNLHLFPLSRALPEDSGEKKK